MYVVVLKHALLKESFKKKFNSFQNVPVPTTGWNGLLARVRTSGAGFAASTTDHFATDFSTAREGRTKTRINACSTKL